MKLLTLSLVFVTLSFASNFGYTEMNASLNPVQGGSDAVTITILNDWTLADVALGLDVLEGAGAFILLAADPVKGHIMTYDPDNADPLMSFDLDSQNGNCFGIVCNNNPDTDTYYTNDWSSSSLYYTENFGSTWTTETNPAGNSARGMDFDGTDYWCTNGANGGLWRFQPGTGQENIAIPEVTGNPSGLTVFPYGSNLGVAVATYTGGFIYFYEWDGSTMDYLGAAACPASCSSSFGLGYSSASNTIYWGYLDGSTYHLAEFSFSITALERSSWGSIKTSF